MGGMNDNDPFAESLRRRLPLPSVSDDLLGRLERRAEWSERPRLRPSLLIGLALALALALYIVMNSLSPETAVRQAPPQEAPEPASFTTPSNIPIALAPPPDEELLETLPALSRKRLDAEPAFTFAPDPVATRGECRWQVL